MGEAFNKVMIFCPDCGEAIEVRAKIKDMEHVDANKFAIGTTMYDRLIVKWKKVSVQHTCEPHE